MIFNEVSSLKGTTGSESTPKTQIIQLKSKKQNEATSPFEWYQYNGEDLYKTKILYKARQQSE